MHEQCPVLAQNAVHLGDCWALKLVGFGDAVIRAFDTHEPKVSLPVATFAAAISRNSLSRKPSRKRENPQIRNPGKERTVAYGYYEEMDAEFNARFDYVSEAYGETARDCNRMAADEVADELREWCEEMEPEYGPYVAPKRSSFRFPVEPAPDFMLAMKCTETEYGPWDDAIVFYGEFNIPW